MMTDYLIIFAVSLMTAITMYGVFDMLKQINKLEDKE
jgi:hypothetical protein